MESNDQNTAKRKPGFQKGGPGGPGRGNKKPGKDGGKLLAAMRAVATQTKDKDRGPLQQICRGRLEENPDGFLTKFARLEAEERRAVSEERKALAQQAQEKGVEKADAATEKVLALIEETLAQAEEEARG